MQSTQPTLFILITCVLKSVSIPHHQAKFPQGEPWGLTKPSLLQSGYFEIIAQKTCQGKKMEYIKENENTHTRRPHSLGGQWSAESASIIPDLQDGTGLENHLSPG